MNQLTSNYINYCADNLLENKTSPIGHVIGCILSVVLSDL